MLSSASCVNLSRSCSLCNERLGIRLPQFDAGIISRMTNGEPNKRESIVDSPWYWAYLFIAAALAILFVAQGRIRSRQAQIETKYQGRQRAVRTLSGQQPDTPLSTPSNTLVQLWPLFVTLTVLLCVTGYGLSRRWRISRVQQGGGQVDRVQQSAAPSLESSGRES